MKIIYLHQYFKFPDKMGGTRSYDLATAFISKGYEVEVIASSPDITYKSANRWSTIERDGIKVHYIYLPYNNQMSHGKRILVFLQFLFFASKKLLEVKSDIVLATSTPLTIGIPALVKKWRQKTPFIFEARDVWPETVIAIGAVRNKVIQKILFHLEKTIYKHAAAIVPLSTDMKRSIVSRYPDFSKKKPIVVIENISEINRFSNNLKSETLKNEIGFKPRFSVLYAGTFGKVNGIDYVIDLAEKTMVLDSSIVFILIGVGVMKKDVIKYANEKKVLNKNVFIRDAVTKQELPALYNSVDMGSSFVIPIKELWANSANKFFDSLASSNPVLINHGGWQAEVIRTENLGFVLPEVVTDGAVTGFVKYTQNQDLIRQQRLNAYEKAKKSYSLEVASEKYSAIFETIYENN